METIVTVVRFYDKYDIDKVAIYVDGKWLLESNGYELIDDFEKILGMVFRAVGDTLVKVNRKYIDLNDDNVVRFPESL